MSKNDLRVGSRGIPIPAANDMKLGIPNEPKIGKATQDDIYFGKGKFNKF